MTLILVGAGHETSLRFQGPGYGRLVQPRDYGRIAETAAAGIPWAADNDCYQGLNAERYRRMLGAISGLAGCLFVTLPDVVGDWEATHGLYREWYTEVGCYGCPVAYVLQDGQPARIVPWRKIDAVFVGGTTEYKLGAAAAALVREAKRRGLWVHMGRVNSRRRYEYARQIGCDSVDGTSYSRWRNTWLPRALLWHREPLQGRLQV